MLSTNWEWEGLIALLAAEAMVTFAVAGGLTMLLVCYPIFLWVCDEERKLKRKQKQECQKQKKGQKQQQQARGRECTNDRHVVGGRAGRRVAGG